MANAVTSLRLCAEIDWPQFVESVSLVERVLQRDPAGVHGRMEFLSRDRYRQAVEELADPTGEAQVRVALRAVESARQAAEVEGTGRARRPRRAPPHREGATGPRGRRRLAPGPVEGAAAPRLRPRIVPLPGLDRHRHRRAGRGRGHLRPSPGRVARRAGRRRLAAPPAVERAGHRLHPATGGPPRAAAPPAASRSRAGFPRTRGPWSSCRPSSPAWPACRSFSSTSRSWRTGTSTRGSIRRPRGLHRRRRSRGARGRAHPRRGTGGRRRAERPPGRGAGRPLLPAPPGAPVEPRGGRVDGVGAERGSSRS